MQSCCPEWHETAFYLQLLLLDLPPLFLSTPSPLPHSRTHCGHMYHETERQPEQNTEELLQCTLLASALAHHACTPCSLYFMLASESSSWLAAQGSRHSSYSYWQSVTLPGIWDITNPLGCLHTLNTAHELNYVSSTLTTCYPPLLLLRKVRLAVKRGICRVSTIQSWKQCEGN